MPLLLHQCSHSYRQWLLFFIKERSDGSSFQNRRDNTLAISVCVYVKSVKARMSRMGAGSSRFDYLRVLYVRLRYLIIMIMMIIIVVVMFMMTWRVVE